MIKPKIKLVDSDDAFVVAISILKALRDAKEFELATKFRVGFLDCHSLTDVKKLASEYVDLKE